MALEPLVEALKGRMRKLQDRRLQLPSEPPYTEAHNTWVANKPGTLLVIPVGDLAQHLLLAFAYLLQNGIVITDDNHLDLEFYDRFYAPGAYLHTHAEHMKQWHT